MPTNFTQTLTGTLRIGGLQFRNLKDATTGYASDVADWTDTTPQPGSADSGAALEDPSSYLSFLWTTFPLVAEGRLVDPGGSGGGTLESWGVIE